MPRGTVFRHEVVNTPTPITSEAAGKSLVASARVYESGTPGAQKLRKVGRRTRTTDWQNDLWDYYDIIPEFRAACSYIANLLSKAVLIVMKDGKPTIDQLALDALASLFGGPEGQEEMLRLLGLNFTVAGEGFVVGKPDADGGDDEWSVIASVEVTGESTDQIKIEDEEVEPGTLAIRLWKAHPRKSVEADSPARALLPTLSEIDKLNQVIASLADSRLKGNGILWVPSELELPSVPVIDVNGDEDEDAVLAETSISAGITNQLIKIASVAMSNRNSAAASVPLVIAAPGEFLDKVQWTDFWTGFDEHAQKLREEARKSIGVGMDMPPEALTGTGDMNHWSAWGVDEAAIKVHTEPLLSVIVSSLTTGYLRPLLKAWGVEDADRYTIEANTAALRMRPNRSKEALELWDRGALSLKTLLVENGFDPDSDVPDEQEQAIFFLSQIARKTSATPDQLAAALARLGLRDIPGETRELETAEDEQRGALERPSLEGHPVTGPPDPEDSKAQVVQASASMGPAFTLDPGLVFACEQAVYRALERAGNKLKARAGSRPRAAWAAEAVAAGVAAADLYTEGPQLSVQDCSFLLEDAWGHLDRFNYGVERERLRGALDLYTLSLLRTKRPYSRDSLTRALLLELSDKEEAA